MDLKYKVAQELGQLCSNLADIDQRSFEVNYLTSGYVQVVDTDLNLTVICIRFKTMAVDTNFNGYDFLDNEGKKAVHATINSLYKIYAEDTEPLYFIMLNVGKVGGKNCYLNYNRETEKFIFSGVENRPSQYDVKFTTADIDRFIDEGIISEDSFKFIQATGGNDES